MRIVDLGPADRIDKLVRRWRERYVDRTPAQAGEADPGAKLRERVWRELEPHLGRPEVVLVSPDGPLNFLPLAALPGSRPGTFLVQEYAFAVAPAPVLLPDLLARKPGRPESPSLLLVGGVDFGKAADMPAPAGRLPAIPTDWKELRGTEREVNDLQMQFQEAFPTAPAPAVLKKDKATKAAFVGAAPSHPYVHLATHGFFADEAETSILDVRGGSESRPPGPGGVGAEPGGAQRGGVRRGQPPAGRVRGGVPADRPGSDGAGPAAGRAGHPVGVRDGEGRTAGGEGVVGLQRAFQVAGARTVVASQWKAPDDATRDLMREFYKRLWDNEPLGKARALQEAQRWMIAKWERGSAVRTEPKDDGGPLPPFFWAAFTLSGDWR